MPVEVHQHYDADGNPTRAADAYLTVVEREPDWTDDDRALAMALDDYQSSLCPCGCNQPIDEAADEARGFRVQTFVCQARRMLEKKKRQEQAKAERDGKPEHWDDGRQYYIDASFTRDEARAERGN